MKKVLIILTTLVAVFGMVACSIIPMYEVTFVTDSEDTKNFTQYVYEGHYVVAPTDAPAKEDYAFTKWYADAAKTVEFDFANTPITDDTVLYADYDQAFITVESEKAFSMDVEGAWDGKLLYSLDGAKWVELDLEDTIEVSDETIAYDTYKVYMRGLDNSVITGESTDGWVLYDADKKAAFVSISGDILTLLDYEDFKAKAEITIGDYAFADMFTGNYITSIPTINILGMGEHSFEETFQNCKHLLISTEAPAEGEYQTFKCSHIPTKNYCDNIFNECATYDSEKGEYVKFTDILITNKTYYISYYEGTLED